MFGVDCGAIVSKERSLASRAGAMEFAKRFMADGGVNDLSSFSLDVVCLVVHSVGFQSLK